jgi:hypothetical protein
MSVRSQAARLAGSLGGRRIAFFVGLALVAYWEARALFVPSPPLRAAGRKPFVITEFGRGVPTGQSFRMKSDGLDAVDLRFFSDKEVFLRLRCRVLGNRPSEPWFPVRDWTAAIHLPRGSSWHRFRFAPVVPSFNLIYQFQVEQLEVRAADPRDPGERPSVGLMGSLDDSLPRDGNIILGSTQVTDRDLFFEARAADSTFVDFRRRVDSQTPLPKPLRSMVAQLTLLAIYNGCLTVFAFHMLIREPKNDDEP